MSTKNNQTPEYDGHCAFAVSAGKLDVMGGKHASTVHGKTYLFSNPIAKVLFQLLPNRVRTADQNWEARQ